MIVQKRGTCLPGALTLAVHEPADTNHKFSTIFSGVSKSRIKKRIFLNFSKFSSDFLSKFLTYLSHNPQIEALTPIFA